MKFKQLEKFKREWKINICMDWRVIKENRHGEWKSERYKIPVKNLKLKKNSISHWSV